jgi:hypothetical protein
MTAPCDIGDDIERRCSNRAAVRKHARDAPVRGLWPGYRSPCGGPSVSGGTRHSNASPHNPRKWRARTLRSRGGSRVPRAEPPGDASRGRGAGIWLTVAACSVIRHCGPSARPITSSSRTSRTRCVAAVCFSHEKKAAPNCRNDCEWRVPLCPLSACAIGCRGGQAAVGCDRGGEGVDLRGGGRVQ